MGEQILILPAELRRAQSKDEQNDQTRHHRQHPERRHANEQRRVFQESECNDDEGEDELQDLPIDRFVNDLKGEFAHEIRHGDDGSSGRSEESDDHGKIENVKSG